jgi:patatin-like phospholipase/acyl hydrolase
MRKVNIVFQVFTSKKWAKTPIVYVLRKVPIDKNIKDIMHCISIMNDYKVVRATRLYLNEKLTPEVAAKSKGEFYFADK